MCSLYWLYSVVAGFVRLLDQPPNEKQQENIHIGTMYSSIFAGRFYHKYYTVGTNYYIIFTSSNYAKVSLHNLFFSKMLMTM